MKRARDRLSNLPNPIIYNILSLMDTKYAVQTCVLSKKWLFHWRNIHSLNFYTKTFTKVSTFRKFVLHVLRRRKPFGVRRLKFLIAYKDRSRNSSVEKKVYDYVALYGGLEELETRFDSKLPESIVQCRSLKTLKLSTYSIEDLQDSFDFASLTTLQLSETSFSQTDNNSFDIFSTCLNLENLILINCSPYGREIFEISAPRLISLSISGFRLQNSIKTKIVISAPSQVNLNISNLIPQGMNFTNVVVISAPRVKFFNFRANYRQTLSIEKCSSLEKMNVRVFPPVAWRETYNWEQGYMFDLLCITEGFYGAKSIDISFKFSKGKFKSYHVNSGAETEVVEISKEVEKKRLWFFDGVTEGVGGVLRDSRGRILCLFSTFLGILDSNSAELWAIHRACHFLDSKQVFAGRSVAIFSDSKNAVSWVKGEGFGNLSLVDLIYDIKIFFQRLPSVTIEFRPRGSNSLVDSLAKSASAEHGDRLEWNVF